MRYRTEVEFTSYIPTVVKFDDTKRFEFRKDKKWHRLQHACFWVLTKIGAFSKGETVTFNRMTIDADDFMEQIFKQRSELARQFYKDGQRLLIGADTFDELMGSKQMIRLRDSLVFDARFNVVNANGAQIMGLKVEIIPWMSGMVVLP
jgi:hypothetical protein